jgi:hypothetical protein
MVWVPVEVEGLLVGMTPSSPLPISLSPGFLGVNGPICVEAGGVGYSHRIDSKVTIIPAKKRPVRRF